MSREQKMLAVVERAMIAAAFPAVPQEDSDDA